MVGGDGLGERAGGAARPAKIADRSSVAESI